MQSSAALEDLGGEKGQEGPKPLPVQAKGGGGTLGQGQRW